MVSNMRTELADGHYRAAQVTTRDAEVMAGMCCTGNECGDLEPVKDIGELLREETQKYRERIQKMEQSLKSSSVKVRTVHKINMNLAEELSSLRRLCVAVDLERRDMKLRLDLEGELVKQMMKQLKQAKAQNCRDVATLTQDIRPEINQPPRAAIVPPQPFMIMRSEFVSKAIQLDECEEDILQVQDICKCDAQRQGRKTVRDIDTPGSSQTRKRSDSQNRESAHPSIFTETTSFPAPHEHHKEKLENIRKELLEKGDKINIEANKLKHACNTTKLQNAGQKRRRTNEDISFSKLFSKKKKKDEFTQEPCRHDEPTQTEKQEHDQTGRPHDKLTLRKCIYRKKKQDGDQKAPGRNDKRILCECDDTMNQEDNKKVRPPKDESTIFEKLERTFRECVHGKNKQEDQEAPCPNDESIQTEKQEHDQTGRPNDKLTLRKCIYRKKKQDGNQKAPGRNDKRILCECDDTMNQEDNKKVRPPQDESTIFEKLERTFRECVHGKNTQEDQKAPCPNDESILCESDDKINREDDQKEPPPQDETTVFGKLERTLGEFFYGKKKQEPCPNDGSLLCEYINRKMTREVDQIGPCPFHIQKLCACKKKKDKDYQKVPSANDGSTFCVCKQKKKEEKGHKVPFLSDGSTSRKYDDTIIQEDQKRLPPKDESTWCKCKSKESKKGGDENARNINYKPTVCTNQKMKQEVDQKEHSNMDKLTLGECINRKIKQERDREEAGPSNIPTSRKCDDTIIQEDQKGLPPKDESTWCKCKSKESKKGGDENARTINDKPTVCTNQKLKQEVDQKEHSNMDKLTLGECINRKIKQEGDRKEPGPSNIPTITEKWERKLGEFNFSKTKQEPCPNDKSSASTNQKLKQEGDKKERSDVDKSPSCKCANKEFAQEVDKNIRSDNETQTLCGCYNKENKDKSDKNGPDGNAATTYRNKSEMENETVGKRTIHTTKHNSDSGSSCSGVCEQYYRNKLLATLEVLKNKEETIRVQGSSLVVAEARITALTERASALRQELDQKARELEKLRSFAISCKIEKSDVSITAELQEVENQKNVVDTLQDNLAVISELYRECFYETAKQEEMIDLMRKSYHEVKLMDKEKTDKISRLQNVINRQKLSIEQCQDVVTEVENLKAEISSFMNSSNNDSGMWERGSESPDVGEELGDILEQLRQLQDMLSSDCACGLQEENKALKEKNESLEMQLVKLKQRMSEMEKLELRRKDSDLQGGVDMENKERKFQEIRRKLAEMECKNVEECSSVETLTKQLQQTEVLLRDTTAELVDEHSVRATQEDTTRRLQCRLQRADKRARESLKKLKENAQLKSMLEESKAQVAELEKRLQGANESCRHLEECCRDQHEQLQEAHARSAALCEESSCITAEMRVHIRRQKELVREQNEKIARQESKISELQRSFDAKHVHSIRTVPNVTDPCCSKFLTPCSARTESNSYPCCSRPHHPNSGSGMTFSPCGLPYPRSVERESERESEMRATCAKCACNRHEIMDRPSVSELASCSSEPTPVPPRRQKKRLPVEDRCAGWFPGPPRFAPVPRVSPTDELLERVGRLHTALADSHQRWTKTQRR